MTLFGLKLRQCLSAGTTLTADGRLKEDAECTMPRTGTGKITLKKGSSWEHLLIERRPGWNKPIGECTALPKRQRSSAQRAAVSRFPLNGSWKMIHEQRPLGWECHQWVHSLICLLDFLLWSLSGGKGSVHNDPVKDVKLSKVLNPYWISHPLNFRSKQSKF